MLTSSQARSMAETVWGRGGTTGWRTNRKGAFCYSCSGHGGFVIDGRAFTPGERAAIDRKATPFATPSWEAAGTGRNLGIFSPFATRPRSL